MRPFTSGTGVSECQTGRFPEADAEKKRSSGSGTGFTSLSTLKWGLASYTSRNYDRGDHSISEDP